MDPATGALTLLGAAISLAKGIERFRNARKQPKECSALFAAAADLKTTLEKCHAFATSAKHIEDRFNAFDFRQHATAANDRLHDLEKSLHQGSSPNGLASLRELKAFWTSLVQGKERVNWCRDELQRITNALNTSLAAVTATTVVPLDGKFDEFAVTQKGIASKQNEILQYVLAIATNTNPGTSPQPPSYNSVVQSQMTRTTPAARQEPQQGSTAIDRVRLPRDRSGKYCVAWCSCRCHLPSYVNSSRTFKDYVGVLSISHSGLPYSTPQKCTEKHCRRRVSPKVSVSYQFPPAVLQRKLELSYSFSALAGPEIRVRLPRVVDWTSPVWQQATAGNVMAVEGLFQNGLASPWDVSPVGGTLLHYATDHWNADLCSLLLEAGLDPNTEDDFKSTGVCIAWERVLSGKMSANDASTVASLFKDTDYLSTRSFTVIHKIVLGLIANDLDRELDGSTAAIDTKDSRGRTPLSWATARGDLDMMRTLLKHQANPNLPDICSHFPLHYAPNTACAELLLDHDAELNVLNAEGQTPLYTACRNIGSASLTDFFLSKGPSDVNKADFSQQTPLHAATGSGVYLPFIDVLVEAGADINARNRSGDSPLRFAVIYNMHELLHNMLKISVEAKFDDINDYGQSFAHAVARMADIQTVKILTEAKPATLEADIKLRDASGKSALDYFEDRLAFLESGEQVELREAFSELIRVLEGGSQTLHEEEVGTDVRAKGDVDYGVPIKTKFDIMIKIDQVADEGSGVGEIFHDAVESF